MPRLIAFMGVSEQMIWVSPAHVTAVMDDGHGTVTVRFSGGQPAQTVQLKGEADAVVAKLNAASD